jgi:hypothetical protein
MPLDDSDRSAIGDTIRAAFVERYRALLRFLPDQIGEDEATKLILSASTAALLQIWRECGHLNSEERVRAAMLSTIEGQWPIICAAARSSASPSNGKAGSGGPMTGEGASARRSEAEPLERL